MIIVVTHEFEFQHLETQDDIEQELELIQEVFGHNTDVDDLVRKFVHKHPSMGLKNFFTIKHRGRIVASLVLIPLEWSIGGVFLKVAEMGCVATLPQYRHQGLQRRLVNEYHRQIAEQGYDLSAIEGIPYFYRQFGYEYAIPLLEETRIEFDQIPDYKSKHKIRPFTNRDIPKAMQLLAQSQERFYVHDIRNEQIWKIQEETSTASEYKFESHAVEDNGEMTAYFRISNDPEARELILREVTETHQKTTQSILNFLKKIGKQRGFKSLVTSISYREYFTDCLVALGGIRHMRPYAWQIRITDLERIFRKIKPLFEKRLAMSPYSHLTEKLNFNFRHYTIQMSVQDGFIASIGQLETTEDRTIGLNPLAFTQLLLGHRSREELEMIYPDFIIRSSHKHLIDTLFPKLPSYIHAGY